MNTLLFEDSFQDVFTLKMQIVTYQKNRKVTKIKIHTKIHNNNNNRKNRQASMPCINIHVLFIK